VTRYSRLLAGLLRSRAWRSLPWWVKNALWTVFYDWRPARRRARKAWRVAREKYSCHIYYYDANGEQHTPFDNGEVPSR
jgi:hypothetical protein